MIVTLGYLYDQIREGILDHLGPVDRYNRMAYASNLKLNRGINNLVKIRLRNRDQKVVNVGGSTFIMSVNDPSTKQELFYITMMPTLASEGVIEGTITEQSLTTLDNRLYHYSVKMIDGEGVEYPVYIDDNFNAAGTIELSGDAYPVAKDSTTITTNYSASATTNLIDLREVAGNGLHTAAWYVTGFTGTIKVQAHMENSTAVNTADWFDVETFSLNDATGVYYNNWTGVFDGIRFVVTVDAGTLDKIVHRY